MRQKAALIRQSLAAAAAKQQQQQAKEQLLAKAMEKPIRKIFNADGVKYTNLVSNSVPLLNISIHFISLYFALLYLKNCTALLYLFHLTF